MRTPLGRILPAIACLLILSGAAIADTLYHIQYPTMPPNGTVVTVEGVVVTGVGRFGVFVQEPFPDPNIGWKYGGCWIYTNNTPTLHKGDLVNLKGGFSVYRGMQEIDVYTAQYGGYLTKVGTATIPDPISVTIPEVRDGGPLADPYLSELVRVDRETTNLVSSATHAQYVNWMLKRVAGGDSLAMVVWSNFPGGDFGYDIPAPGTPVTYATGILVRDSRGTQHNKIAPRDCENDLGMGCIPHLQGAYATSSTGCAVQFGVALNQQSAEDISNYELVSGVQIYSAHLDPNLPKRVFLITGDDGNAQQETVIAHGIISAQGVPMSGPESQNFRTGLTPISMITYKSDPVNNDNSDLLGEVVTVRGWVSELDGANYYFLQDEDGGPWTGVYIYVARNFTLKPGDVMTVAGRVNEYNGMTEVSYTTGVDYQVYPTTTHAVVTNTLTTSQLKYHDPTGSAEQWEGNVVKLVACRTDSIAGVVGPYLGQWMLYQRGLGDTSKTAINQINGAKAYAGCVGDTITIRGICGQYSTGPLSQYEVWPSTGRGYDIQVIYDNPACAPSGLNDAAALVEGPALRGLPNPFGVRTTIRFEIPSREAVRLEIIDPSGRLVRTLLNGSSMTPGSHDVAWDGRDNDGHAVGAGTYFARLQGTGGTVAAKLIVLH